MTDAVRDRQEAIEAARILHQDITSRARNTSAGRNIVNQPLRNWFIEWMGRKEQRETGQVVSPILRLSNPSGLIEIMKSTGVYNGLPIGLMIRLKAVSSVQVMVAEDNIIKNGSHQGAYVDGGVPEIIKRYKELAAGEEILMAPHFAIAALQAHSRSAWHPELWETSGAIPQTDALVEVGFTTIIEDISVPAGEDGPVMLKSNTKKKTKKRSASKEVSRVI